MAPRKRARSLRSFGEIRWLIEESLRASDEFSDQVRVDGRLDSFNDGHFHENYRCFVNDPKAPREVNERPLLIRLLARKFDWQHDAKAAQRIAREAETLRRLQELDFPFAAPRYVCDVREGECMIGFIETFIAGSQLECLKSPDTIEYLASAFAAVHDLPITEFDHLPRYESRRDHLSARLDGLDWTLLESYPNVPNAKSWIQNHLPPPDPPTVLHGDIQTHNVLAELSGNMADSDFRKLGIVDWQAARIGDPAYDFAVLTRGTRKVAQVPNGLAKLLSAYRQCGGQPLAATDVRCHELVLIMGWLEDSLRDHSAAGPSAHHYVQLLGHFLSRLASRQDAADMGADEIGLKSNLAPRVR